MGMQECPLRKRERGGKRKEKEKESEKKKIEEGIEWREWMPDLRDKGIFQTIPYHYSACHVTPRHRPYKLTISQRSSILQPSLSSTIRFLLFVSLPYLFAFTRAFISTDIHHDFPPRSILIQTFSLRSARNSSWDPFKIPVRVVATSATMENLQKHRFGDIRNGTHTKTTHKIQNAFLDC